MKGDRVVLVRSHGAGSSYGSGRPDARGKGFDPRRFVVCSSRDLLLGILIVVILIMVAMPHYVATKKSAQAARVVCDFNLISTATMAAYSELGELPPNDRWGHVPSELAPYLPAGFKFKHKGVSYRWRRWCLPTGLPERPEQKILLGVQVRTEDVRMLHEIVNVYRGRLSQLREKQITLVIL